MLPFSYIILPNAGGISPCNPLFSQAAQVPNVARAHAKRTHARIITFDYDHVSRRLKRDSDTKRVRLCFAFLISG